MESTIKVSFRVTCADARYDMGHHVAICRLEKKCPQSSEKICSLGTLQTNGEMWPAWTIQYTLPVSTEMEYKFFFVKQNGEVHWEKFGHRSLYISPEDTHDCFTVFAVYGIPAHQILSGCDPQKVLAGDRIKDLHAVSQNVPAEIVLGDGSSKFLVGDHIKGIHAASPSIPTETLIAENRAQGYAEFSSHHDFFQNFIDQLVEQVSPHVADSPCRATPTVSDRAGGEESELDFDGKAFGTPQAVRAASQACCQPAYQNAICTLLGNKEEQDSFAPATECFLSSAECLKPAVSSEPATPESMKPALSSQPSTPASKFFSPEDVGEIGIPIAQPGEQNSASSHNKGFIEDLRELKSKVMAVFTGGQAKQEEVVAEYGSGKETQVNHWTGSTWVHSATSHEEDGSDWLDKDTSDTSGSKNATADDASTSPSGVRRHSWAAQYHIQDSEGLFEPDSPTSRLGHMVKRNDVTQAGEDLWPPLFLNGGLNPALSPPTAADAAQQGGAAPKPAPTKKPPPPKLPGEAAVKPKPPSGPQVLNIAGDGPAERVGPERYDMSAHDYDSALNDFDISMPLADPAQQDTANHDAECMFALRLFAGLPDESAKAEDDAAEEPPQPMMLTRGLAQNLLQRLEGVGSEQVREQALLPEESCESDTDGSLSEQENSPVESVVPEDISESPSIKSSPIKELVNVRHWLSLATRKKERKMMSSGASASEFMQRVIVALVPCCIPSVLSLTPREEDYGIGEGLKLRFQYLASPSEENRIRMSVLLASFSTFAGGGIGGVSGSVFGGVCGAAVGLVAAPLTFGFSVPVGVAIGGIIGCGAGATGGSALGLAAGLLASRMAAQRKSNRDLYNEAFAKNLAPSTGTVAVV